MNETAHIVSVLLYYLLHSYLDFPHKETEAAYIVPPASILSSHQTCEVGQAER